MNTNSSIWNEGREYNSKALVLQSWDPDTKGITAPHETRGVCPLCMWQIPSAIYCEQLWGQEYLEVRTKQSQHYYYT